MPIVTFRHTGGEEIRTEVPAGLTLLEAAKQAGVAIDAPCGGSGTCGVSSRRCTSRRRFEHHVCYHPFNIQPRIQG